MCQVLVKLNIVYIKSSRIETMKRGKLVVKERVTSEYYGLERSQKPEVTT